MLDLKPSLSRASRAADQARSALEQGRDDVAKAFMKSLIDDVAHVKRALNTLEVEHAR